MSFPSTLSASSLRHFSLTPLSSLGCQGLSLNSLSPTSSFPRLLDAKISKKLRRLPTTNPSTKTSTVNRYYPPAASSFNPTMVRLLPTFSSAPSPPFLFVSIPQWCDCCVKRICGNFQIGKWFQSHNGAIAAFRRCHLYHLPKSFQSHNGAIAAPIALNAPAAIDACFNPTMVRLLQTSCRPVQILATWFQSHNGAIAATAPKGMRKWGTNVSIPQWCDCC